MNTVNFTNNTQVNSLTPEVKKRLEAQENFTAIDKEKLKQDVAEFQEKAEEHVKENFVVRILKNIGIKDPKKFFISLGATFATVIGLATLGNKSSNYMAELGLKVDDFLLSQKWYQKASEAFQNGKNKVVSVLKKSKTISNIMDTLKNRPARAKCDLTRGYGQGFKGIFSLTPVDVLKNVFNGKTPEQKAASLKKLVGENNLNELLSYLNDSKTSAIKTNREFCEKLTEGIKLNNGITTKHDLMEFFKKLQKGEGNLSEFKDITMKDKGLYSIIGSWWPVNIIDSVGKKLFKNNWKGFCKGNLGDSLVKFNVVNGSMASTKLGSLVQKSITVPTESITNFVNDKSGMGLFLCSSIMALYNNVQDAPKEKRVATIADDYMGTIGSIAIATPLAYAATYGLASLKNVDPNVNFKSKIVKQIGKFFGMGLDKTLMNGTVKEGTKNIIFRFGGGAIRLFLVMFAFSPFFSKPIKKVINKIFGKPYDAAQAEREKQIEAQRNTIIPELGITQGELEEKIKANPDALVKIQSNPAILREIQKNPKLIVDILDGKEIKIKPSGVVCEANKDLINKNKNSLNNSQATNNINPYANNAGNSTSKLNNSKTTTSENIENQEKSEVSVDTATYIPSSQFTVKSSGLSDIQAQEYNQMMTNADRALEQAEKYI